MRGIKRWIGVNVSHLYRHEDGHEQAETINEQLTEFAAGLHRYLTTYIEHSPKL